MGQPGEAVDVSVPVPVKDEAATLPGLVAQLAEAFDRCRRSPHS